MDLQAEPKLMASKTRCWGMEGSDRKDRTGNFLTERIQSCSQGLNTDICTSDHPPQPRQNTISCGNLVSKDVDAKISTNALVKCEEVECPFFIHSTQKLTLHFLSTPTVLMGYSRPTDGKEAKPSTPIRQAWTQDDLQAEAVSTCAMATLLYLQGLE